MSSEEPIGAQATVAIGVERDHSCGSGAPGQANQGVAIVCRGVRGSRGLAATLIDSLLLQVSVSIKNSWTKQEAQSGVVPQAAGSADAPAPPAKASAPTSRLRSCGVVRFR